MPDIADIASAVTDAQMDDQLAIVRKRDAANARMTAAIHEDAGFRRECDECGDDIPRARLLAVPSTKRCASCQEDYEAAARMRG